MFLIAVSVLHGCVLSLSVLIPALCPQSWDSACVAGKRLSAALVFCLHLSRVTVFPELTTEGRSQRAVYNLKYILDFIFSGCPPFAERVQQQTGIFPWPGLSFLEKAIMNYRHVPPYQILFCLQTGRESREVVQLYLAAQGDLQYISGH